jgi:hypothetical protein
MQRKQQKDWQTGRPAGATNGSPRWGLFSGLFFFLQTVRPDGALFTGIFFCYKQAAPLGLVYQDCFFLQTVRPAGACLSGLFFFYRQVAPLGLFYQDCFFFTDRSPRWGLFCKKFMPGADVFNNYNQGFIIINV